MVTPKISLFATAARPQNWRMFYDSIGENDVAWEVVFVGPNPPDYELPDNFVYVKTNVKPAQCAEIAIRHASGDLIMWVCDDMRFTTDHPLDEMYRVYREAEDELTVVSAILNDPEISTWNHFYGGDLTSPEVALCGMMSKRVWLDVGGVDRRFVALTWDLDVTLGVLARGGKVVYSDVHVDMDYVLPNDPTSKGTILHSEQRWWDRQFLDGVWTENGKVRKERVGPHEPFDDEDLLTKSQHPRGHWKYQNERLNKLASLVTKYKMRQWRSKTFGRLYRFTVRVSPRPISNVLAKLWANRVG